MALFRFATAVCVVCAFLLASRASAAIGDAPDRPAAGIVVTEQVVVNHGPGGPADAGAAEELSGTELDELPSGADAVDDTLATSPGVVRAGAMLTVRGGRTGQGGAQLGSMTLSDPASGEFRARVPVETVASVEVMVSPVAAEFGRFASGLLLMLPQQGGERWRLRARKVDPAFRFARGNPLRVHGVRSFGPRVSLQGPLVPGRLYLAQTAQYLFSRGNADSGLRGDDGRQEFLSSVTRLDAQLGPRHRIEALAGFFPERRDNANRTTFVPAPASYDEGTAASALSLSHSGVLGSTAVLTTSLHSVHHRLWLGPVDPGPWSLEPDGASGRYFNRQDRHADTLQWVESISLSGRGALGEQLTVLGLDLLRVSFESGSASGPVEVRREDGTLARRLTFDGGTRQGLRTTDVAAFATTSWRPVPAVNLQLALRLDRDGVTRTRVLAPRLGAAWQGASGRVSARAALGVFTERTPSLVGAFSGLEARTETRFAEDGRTELGRVRYLNESAAGLVPARSLTWSGGLSYLPTARLRLQLGALQRQGRHEPVVEPVVDGDVGRLVLASRGRSRYRELETAVHYQLRPRFEVSLAWVHSHAEADFNGFAALFGTALAPVVRENAFALASTDVPERLVARAGGPLGRAWRFSAALDVHSGMPWSAVDAGLEYLGPRNGRRLPAAALLDLAVERAFRVGRWRPWIGVAVVNALKSSAAREVQTNVAASDYGAFYNAVPRRLRLSLTLDR